MVWSGSWPVFSSSPLSPGSAGTYGQNELKTKIHTEIKRGRTMKLGLILTVVLSSSPQSQGDLRTL